MNMRNIAIVAFVLAAGAFAYVYFNKTAEPGAAVGAPLVAVTVPTLSAAEAEGEKKYAQFCAACHGANTAGQEGVAPPFVHPIYEPNHHGDQAFYAAAQNGVRAHHWPFGDMPPVQGITEDDVTQIITYVRAIQRANGIS